MLMDSIMDHPCPENDLLANRNRCSILGKQYSVEGKFVQACIQDEKWTRSKLGVTRYPYCKMSSVNVEQPEQIPLEKSTLDTIRDSVEQHTIGKEETDLRNLFNNILLEIVHNGSVKQLENFLDWFHNELLVTKKNASIWGKWKKEMKGDPECENIVGKHSLNRPLIEASLYNDYDKVLVFLNNGFRIDDSTFKEWEECQAKKSASENKDIQSGCLEQKSWLSSKLPVFLNRYLKQKKGISSSQAVVNFHATSMPAYILAKYIRDIVKKQPRERKRGESVLEKVPPNDPVSESFENAYIAEIWKSSISNDYNLEKLLEILTISQKFIVDMLKQCKTLKEAALFFSFDSKMKKYYKVDDDNQLAEIYGRLNMAIEQNYVDLSTHEFTQSILGTRWVMSDYHGGIIQWYNTNMVDQSLYVLRNMILLPLHVICFLIRALVYWDYYDAPSPALLFEEEKPNNCFAESESKSCTDKISNVFCHLASHYTFPINRSIGSFISHICFLVLIFLSILNPNDEIGKVDIDWYDYLVGVWATAHVYDYVSRNIILNIVRFRWNKTTRRKYLHNLKLENIFWHLFYLMSFLSIFLGTIFKWIGVHDHCGTQGIFEFTDCSLVDPSQLHDNSIAKTGYGFFGIGFTLCTIKTLYWAQLNPAIGPLIIALKKVMKDVLRILFVFLLFLSALSIGMNYMLKISNVYCEGEPGYNQTTHQYYNRNTSEVIERDAEGFDIEKVENKFRSLRSSLKTAMWSLFDPGHPEVVGCTKAPLRYLGLGMWGLYQFVNVVILLNLLIALMNATVMTVDVNKIKEWQFARTRVWLRYFDKKSSIPVPFNILEHIVWLLIKIMKCFGKNKTTKEVDIELQKESNGISTEEEYNLLMLELRKRYIENNTKQDLQAGSKYTR